MRQAFAFAEDRYIFNKDYPAGANWYELMIEQATPAGRIMNSATSAMEEPTMIVLNVGAHLREFELGANLLASDYIEGLKNLVSHEAERRPTRSANCPREHILMLIYCLSKIDCVEQKLQNAPIPLSPVLRTMAPGHVDCHKDIERKFRSLTDRNSLNCERTLTSRPFILLSLPLSNLLTVCLTLRMQPTTITQAGGLVRISRRPKPTSQPPLLLSRCFQLTVN